MRLPSIIVLIVLLAALPAAATDSSTNKERSNSSSSSSTSTSTTDTSNSGLTQNGGGISNIGGTSTDADFGLIRQLSGKKTKKKWWEVGLAFEFHRLFIQNDLNGNGVNALFMYYSAYAQADITQYDRVSIRGGFYEYLLDDAGETGVRASDIDFVYSRRIPLPWQLNLRLTGYLTAPTSYSSYLATSVTTPSVSVTLSRRFFRDLEIDLRALAHYYWTKYSTNAGGDPNAQVSWGWEAQVEYDLPFFRSLTLGADIYTEYYLDYPSAQGSFVPDYALTQPIEQSYGGEAYIRYTLPTLAGIGSDVTAAYATGDPSEGYPNILHDGVQEIYAFWRESSEFYFIVSMHY